MAEKSIQNNPYPVAFVDRTEIRDLVWERGYAKQLMPLAPNANHVNVMYLGALTVLAEATAAKPGISILDTEKHFPIVKNIAVDFHRMAATDITAEYRLSEEKISELEADLKRKGSSAYMAEVPMYDAQGDLVATGKVTMKLLSHNWEG